MTIIKKFDPDKFDKKFPKKYIALFVVGLLSLIIIEVWVVNAIITYGKKFDEMSSIEHALKMEKQILENEIAMQSSLSHIATSASELGFSKPASIQYIR